MVPIIDRELSPNGLGKVRKHSSWIPVLAVVFVAVLVLGAIAGLMVQIANDKGAQPSETPTRIPAGILYTTHSPISIIGNAGFTNASGVVWGRGTPSDPYIIADWDIDASTADGISVQGTDAHFIVRNCSVHDGNSGLNVGIFLSNCFNGTLENNSCSNDYYGIILNEARHNNLSNNICSGIRLDLSNNNTISNNTCHGDMYLWLSGNNTLSNNTCSNGADGIYLERSSNNTLTYNNCSSNSDTGIYLWLSSNNTIRNNNCSNNNYGMGLEVLSKNNTISGNMISGNAGYGIIIYSYSNNNSIWNNTFTGNNGAGSTYDSSHVQAYDDVTNNSWNSSYGYGNWWSDWTTLDADHDGIVDQPYAVDGSAGAEDYYPLTTVQTQIPEFGMMPFAVMAIVAMIVLAGETWRRKKSVS
jgi:parallel beta-helix repeat protein